MASNVRVEDRLEGATNFFSWKIWITTILEELELESFIEEDTSMLEHEAENPIGKGEIIKLEKSLSI